VSGNWLGVAAADHVQRGLAAGFMQVCHGSLAPLRRIRAGDRIVYYSPRREFGSAAALRAFTAIGTIAEGEPYAVAMAGGFRPFRRDVRWLDARPVPIAPLLDRLDLTAGGRNWGYQLRRGIVPLSDHDLALIAAAMGTAFCVPPPVAPEAEIGNHPQGGKAKRIPPLAVHGSAGCAFAFPPYGAGALPPRPLWFGVEWGHGFGVHIEPGDGRREWRRRHGAAFCGRQQRRRSSRHPSCAARGPPGD
jgi:hypothetical protein